MIVNIPDQKKDGGVVLRWTTSGSSFARCEDLTFLWNIGELIKKFLTDQRARLFMSKEEGQGLTFFLSRRHRYPLFFFLILFFAFCIFFSCFLPMFFCCPCPNSFSVQRFRHWFGASSYRASYRNGESRCLFAFSLLRPVFQSDREGISLVRPPFVVLTRTNSPRHPLCVPSVPFLWDNFWCAVFMSFGNRNFPW